jgi:hypothetical protein
MSQTPQAPKTKFSPEYRATLHSVIFRVIEKEALSTDSKIMQDAKIVAQQNLRTATDEVMK